MSICKKIVSLIIAAVMLVGVLPLFAGGSDDLPFTDVSAKKWYYKSVKYVWDNGLMNGMSKTSFEPNGTLSRAMFITIIGRLVDAGSDVKPPFPDTKPGAWYSPYVAWAAELGVVDGFPDGTFRPNDPITREQMAAATDRFLKAVGLRTVATGGIFDFTDEAKFSKWSRESIGSLKKIGIFAGDNEGRFNPKSNTTRAEAATVIMRLKQAIDAAWQGYLPSPDEDPVVYGAKYLFENGSILGGGMKRGLDLSGEYPALTLENDFTASWHTPLPSNSAGVSLSYAGLDPARTPYVKICYGFDGMDETVPEANLTVNRVKRAISLPLATAEEDGFATAVYDLTPALEESGIDVDLQMTDVLFTPSEEGAEGKFTVRYIAFFDDLDEAVAFGAGSSEDIADYLKNYDIGITIDYREYTEADREYYEGLMRDRIAEIKNSPSEITPEMIKKNGGTCYYVSSIHGDDSNDGLSPETPWKTTAALLRYIPQINEYSNKIRKGDGVFFERGSVFYPKIYHNHQVSNLTCADGAYYGAYGEGPKPVFTCSLDFSEYDNVGNWQPSGYDNIWVIDKIDETVRVNEDGTEDPTYWWGENSQITNMYFNGGEAVGLKIAGAKEQSFGEGRKTVKRGLYFNGYEYIYADVRSLENPGTALQNNLEFFHDFETGSLYLYWDKGNPADYFDEIKASRTGTGMWGANGIVVDNLAFLYAGITALTMGAKSVTVQNCEAGFVHGDISSMESGIGSSGTADGILVRNCYVHDVGDGGITNQNTGQDPEKPIQISNVSYVDNVMVACGHSAEIWNHMTGIDENGYSASRITNALLKNNIMAYSGYSSRQKQDLGYFSTGECVCGSVYGEISDSRIEGNIFLYGMGTMSNAYMATYLNPRGWECLGNVYISDGDSYAVGKGFEAVNSINHFRDKASRIFRPYTEEGLKWYASLGVDPKGVYYHYTTDNPNEKMDGEGFYFMTGYYAERGVDPTRKFWE